MIRLSEGRHPLSIADRDQPDPPGPPNSLLGLTWWRASRLLDATFGHLDSESQIRAYRECHADLLVIDDLGHNMGRRGLEILCNIIDARRDDDLATIFTIDMPLVALCERYPALRWRLTSDTIAVPFDQTYEERTNLC